MIRKTLSYSDMATFLDDPEKYIERVTSPRKPPEHIHQLVGNVVHAMAPASAEKREQILERQLNSFPEEELAEARERINRFLDAADSLSREGDGKASEVQLSWKDPVTGWTLKAKPDELSMLDWGNGEMMEIADLKTASRLKYQHKSQLFFFGLVATLARNYQGPIKLVVKLLGSGTEETFWYSPKATGRSLDKVRNIIRQIERLLTERGLLQVERLANAS